LNLRPQILNKRLKTSGRGRIAGSPGDVRHDRQRQDQPKASDESSRE
jgi:hypothetical protein